MTPARLDLLSALVDEFIVEHATNWQTATLGQVHRWVQEVRDRELRNIVSDNEPVYGVPV